MARLRSHTAAIVAAMATLVLVGSVAAMAVGTTPPPPRTAFVANAFVPADALAAGPAAGRLGAPIFTTPQGFLAGPAETGLVDYGPDLVVVLGGVAAIDDAVVAQIAAATALTVEDIGDIPATGIVRVAGAERTETAQKIADLFSAYDPGFLPANGKAFDADLLDGKDSTDFLHSDAAIDADTLDGLDASAFALAPTGTTRTVACGLDEFTLHPANEAGFSGVADYVTYDYDGWGVNAYQEAASTTLRCTIDLPPASTLQTVDVFAYDSDGYNLPGCTSRLQTFDAGTETVATLGTTGGTAGVAGSVTLDASPDDPAAIPGAGVLTVDCEFMPMTGGPRDLGYRGVAATVEIQAVP